MPTPRLTVGQRQARHRAKGFVVSATLLDPAAIAALARLRAGSGESIRIVLERALVALAARS